MEDYFRHGFLIQNNINIICLYKKINIDFINIMEDKLNYLVNFIENNLDKLLQIYINERNNIGDGILSVRGNQLELKVDVGYISMNNLDDFMKNKINELNTTTSKAYFIAYDINYPNNNLIIEKELREK